MPNTSNMPLAYQLEGSRVIVPGDDALEYLFNERGRWRELPSEWNPNPHALVEREELLGVLNDCLKGLPRRQADVFTMRVMDDMSTEEACKLLDVTATNLGVLLHRARLRLRQCLEQNWFGLDGEEAR